MKRVLITGAAGEIGTRLRVLLKPIYPELVASDLRRPAAQLISFANNDVCSSTYQSFRGLQKALPGAGGGAAAPVESACKEWLRYDATTTEK